MINDYNFVVVDAFLFIFFLLLNEMQTLDTTDTYRNLLGIAALAITKMYHSILN